MSKRIIGLLLAALLALPYWGTALAAPGDLMLFESQEGVQNEWIEYAAVAGDTVYLKGNKLFTWKMGQQEPELFFDNDRLIDTSADGEPQWNRTRGLFILDGVPMTLEPVLGALCEYTKDGLKATDYKLDMGTLPGATGDALQDAYLIDGAQMISGKLLLLARQSENDWDKNHVLSVDLQTGKIAKLSDTISRIMLLSPYKEGKALVGVDASYGSGYNHQEGKSPFSLNVMDLETGKLEGEPYSPVPGYANVRTLAYDEEGDTLYFTAGNRVYRSKYGAEPEVVNYLSREAYSASGAAFLLDGKLIVPGYEGTAVCSVDPSLLPKSVLRVMGNWYTQELHPAFLRENPDIAVNSIDDSVWDLESVARMIQGGEAADVFTFSSSSSIQDLIDKGYALDLSGDQVLMDTASAFYPQVQGAVMRDGKLYGLPVRLDAQFWAYDVAAFDECGLTYPETMSDYMDLLVEWDDIQDDVPDRNLLDSYSDDLKEQLFWQILNNYAAAYAKPDEPLSFDHPAFREPMLKLESLPYKFLTDAEREAMNGRMVEYEYKEPLMETYASLEGYGGMYPKKMMAPPRLNADSEPYIEGNLTMLIVNPYSENKDAALQYLRYMAEHMSEMNRIAMDPSRNEPVENPWYRQNIEWYEKYIKELQEQEVEPEKQREHDAELERMQRNMEQEAENGRWRVSKERLQGYRELAPLIRIGGSSVWAVFGNNYEEFDKILARYRQGQLNLDQMIRELDQKAEMIFLETR